MNEGRRHLIWKHSKSWRDVAIGLRLSRVGYLKLSMEYVHKRDGRKARKSHPLKKGARTGQGGGPILEVLLAY